MVHQPSLILLSLFSAVAYANNWSVPCFTGECSYVLPQTSPQAPSGLLKILGSPDAITDITEAAGWQIVGCDNDAMIQDIHIVCTNNDTAQSGCNHLYQNTDPVGKIVRLPENCGKMPFARIANESLAANQTIPSHIAKRLVRRDGVLPEVRTLSVDTNFTAIDPAKAGNVSIAIQGSSVPGAPPAALQRRSTLEARGSDFISSAIGNFLSFDKTDTTAVANISVVKPSFNLINYSLACPQIGQIPPFNASLIADMDVDSHAVVTVGVAASGSIVPPELTDFSVFATFSANISGTLKVNASLAGTISSPRLPLFQTTLGGLDFPGILTVGPTFNLTVGASTTLGVNLDVEVDVNYQVQNAQLVLPESDEHKCEGNFAPAESPIKLSAPFVAGSTTLAVNLIPELDLGIKAFGGVAQATVFLNLVAGADVAFSLNTTETSPSAAKNSTPSALNYNSSVSSYSPSSVSNYGGSSAPDNATLGGCVEVDTSLAVNVGVRGTLFTFFHDQVTIPLYSKKFVLYQKCLGNSTTIPTKRYLIDGSYMPRYKEVVPEDAGIIYKDPVIIPRTRRSNALHHSHFSRRPHHVLARNNTIPPPHGEPLICLALQALDSWVNMYGGGASIPTSTIAVPSPAPTTP